MVMEELKVLNMLLNIFFNALLKDKHLKKVKLVKR